MAEIEKKKVSELTEESNPVGFWIFGYKELANGARQSARVLFDKLLSAITDVAANLQLERRIALTMENEIQKMYFGEETTIYKVDSENVSKLEISVDGGSSFSDISLTQDADIVIPLRSKALFRATRSGVNTEMFIYLYAKAKVQ